ncbi:YqaJ viral recombinase family nuclease [Actinomadura violacea]|uniref:YqaJ viral recombinase family protein n=1 Tax=Actinomadura violacea TaxID=2819934 RepID=A0ABS3S7N0_9ACTN|nr:YqaJ viral recombinase family protein [Actinomadura violacea]MBO2465007.1 YqaJ viral recombinase family protein [Actinomadura violacea]
MTAHELDARPGELVTPTGVLVLPSDVPRPRWLAARRSGIGGSDALAVAGLDPWTTRLEVYLTKTGSKVERPQTDDMVWGQIVEPAIAEYFTHQTGIEAVRCGLMRHTDRDWQLASVDRLTGDGGLLEIKNTNHWRRGEWEDGQIADGAEAQTQHYLDVTGLSHAWVAAQVGGAPPLIRRVERDEALIADLRAMEEEFWELVRARTPPPLEGGKAAEDLVCRMFPRAKTGLKVEVGEQGLRLLRDYNDAHLDEVAAKARKQRAKTDFTHLMGEAQIATYRGQEVATWDNASKTSYKQKVLEERYPDAAAAARQTNHHRKFLNKLPKELITDGA